MTTKLIVVFLISILPSVNRDALGAEQKLDNISERGVAKHAAGTSVEPIAQQSAGSHIATGFQAAACTDDETEKQNQDLVLELEAEIEARVLAYASNISAARSAVDSGKIEKAGSILAATNPIFRGWEYNYLLDESKRRGATGLKGVHVLEGYTSGAAFSLDGKRLFVSNGRDVTVWDYKNNKSKKLGEHKNGVSCVAASPDGKKFASGAWDGKIIVWDANIGDQLLEYSGHNPEDTRPGAAETQAVRSLCFSPDSTKIVSTAFVNSPFVPNIKPEVKIWSAESGETLKTLEGRHSDGREFAVACVAYNSDGRLIATGGYDSTVRLWDAKSGREIRTLKGHTNNVLDVAFSPDGKRIASASIDGTVAIWKVSDGQQIRRLNAGGYSVFSVEFSPDGKRLVSAGSESSVRMWDADTGVELDKLPKTKIPYRFVIFSPDGKHIAAGGDSPSRLSGTAIWETSPASYERPDE